MRRFRGGSGSDLHALMRLPRNSNVLNVPDLGVAHAIVGGVATRAYMPERSTLDVDLLVQTHDLETARVNLRKAGGERVSALRPEPGLGLAGEEWRVGEQLVDLFWGADAWIAEAVSQAQAMNDNIVPLPYLVMMKMNSARGVDQGDLTRMLGFADGPTMKKIREIIGRFRPDFLADLEQYIEVGKLEVGRSRAEDRLKPQ